MVQRGMNALKPDADDAFHWEFTLASDARCRDSWGTTFWGGLGQKHFERRNGRTGRAVYPPLISFYETRRRQGRGDRAGVPYMPIAPTPLMFPSPFGIRDERMQEMVDRGRAKGAELVVFA